MTVAPATRHPFDIAPENVTRGGDRFVPGQVIPGKGGDEFVDGAETAGGFDGVADVKFLGKDGLDFSDLLDVINPLQHLPIIGDIYRSITGDQISAPARMAGGTLFGGPIGFVSSLVNTIVEEATGSDIGGNVLALFSTEEAVKGAVQTATAATAGTAAASAGASIAAKAGEKLSSAEPLPPSLLPPSLLPGGAAGLFNTGMANSQVGLPQPPLPTLLPEVAAKGMQGQFSNVNVANRSVPHLSPSAFQTLMSSVNGQSQPKLAARQGLTAGAELPPVSKGSIRDAGLEINRLLRPHAK